MGSPERDCRVGSLEHRHVVGAVANGDDALETAIANALDRLALVEDVSKANHAILGGSQRRVPAASYPFDNLIYPDIQVARDDEALVGPGLDESRDPRIKLNVVDDGV